MLRTSRQLYSVSTTTRSRTMNDQMLRSEIITLPSHWYQFSLALEIYGIAGSILHVCPQFQVRVRHFRTNGQSGK